MFSCAACSARVPTLGQLVACEGFRTSQQLAAVHDPSVCSAESKIGHGVGLGAAVHLSQKGHRCPHMRCLTSTAHAVACTDVRERCASVTPVKAPPVKVGGTGVRQLGSCHTIPSRASSKQPASKPALNGHSFCHNALFSIIGFAADLQLIRTKNRRAPVSCTSVVSLVPVSCSSAVASTLTAHLAGVDFCCTWSAPWLQAMARHTRSCSVSSTGT
jgi:hypothetical protein